MKVLHGQETTDITALQYLAGFFIIVIDWINR